MTQEETTARPAAFFSQMMRVAGDLGCQLKPNKDNPHILRGLCPFHEGNSLQNLKTLVVNSHKKKFWCTHCDTGGNPLAFIAMSWSISVRDTRELLKINGDNVTSERPQYPRGFFRNEAREGLVPQNTAVLTLAMRHFGQQLKSRYEPMHFLARLGVDPEEAVRIGVGYCTGQGLREYLAERGIREQEIEVSPLFQADGLESMTRRLVVADTDYSGAATWMTSLRVEEEGESYRWSEARPITYGLPGFKSYIFNSKEIYFYNPQILLTDDIRLYILAAASRIPSSLITRRRREKGGNDETARRITGVLSERGVRRMIIAIHDREKNERIQEVFTKHSEMNRAKSLYKKDIVEALNLNSRNMEILQSIPEGTGVNPPPSPQHESPGTQEASPLPDPPSPRS